MTHDTRFGMTYWEPFGAIEEGAERVEDDLSMIVPDFPLTFAPCRSGNWASPALVIQSFDRALGSQR
jgi:hypothetical protein